VSVLHKLESMYGNFIRLLSALLTLALLAIAVVALVNWQRATASEDSARKSVEAAPPKVSSVDIVKRVVASQMGQSADPIRSSDPNRAAFERIEKAIKAFAQKHPSDEDLDADSLSSLARSNTDDQDTVALKAAYASGLADTLERTLADPKIEALFKPSREVQDSSRPSVDVDRHSTSDEVGPMSIVHETIEQYDTDFSEQLSMTASMHDDHDDGRKQRDAWLSLARVGGPMLLLILVLQLLTFGRIEQNTRFFDRSK